MSPKTKTVLLIALFALFIAASVFAYHHLGKSVGLQNEGNGDHGDKDLSQKGEEGENEKTRAPDFTVYDADGSAVMLSDFFGKPIVLNFWASWCPPCKGEMPEFDAIHGQAGGEVTFMMVDLVDGQRETEEKGAQYVKEKGFTFPVYYDLDGEAAQKYGISSIPRTYFIDKEGYIETWVEGAIDGKTLQKKIGLIE